MTFLKWNGGKGNVLSDLDKLFPSFNNIRGYAEPFIGGGSVFFHIMKNYWKHFDNKPIYISDINVELINSYRVVRDNPYELMKMLDKIYDLHDTEYFKKVRDNYNIYRSEKNEKKSPIERAANFIYLNKTCFNGQMRVNSEGRYNMGIGHPEKIALYDPITFSECSRILRESKCKIVVASFENILKLKDTKGFFVYEDPPYFDTDDTKTKNFVGYTKDKFNKRVELKNVFSELDKRGAKVMMSNSNSDIVLHEFKNFNIHEIMARRSVSASSEYRCNICEYVVTNYKSIKRQQTMDDFV